MAVRPNWKQLFLAALASSGNVRASCQAAGVDRDTSYKAKARDSRFAEAWELAIEDACDRLEAEARRRAVDGVTRERGLYYQGEQIAVEKITEYSDGLLVALLKAHRPAKFRERYEITGAESGPVTFTQIAQRVASRRAVKTEG